MFVLLKTLAWFLLFLFANILIELIIYYAFMSFFAYRWSIRSSIIYLLANGCGNRPDRNIFIAGVDILTRLIWVNVYAAVYIIAELALITYRIRVDYLTKGAMITGLVVAILFFVVVIGQIERHSMFRIGRLVGVDKTSRVAFFTDLSDNKAFTYSYGEEKEEYLQRNSTYLVADYSSIFAMFVSMDM